MLHATVSTRWFRSAPLRAHILPCARRTRPTLVRVQKHSLTFFSLTKHYYQGSQNEYDTWDDDSSDFLDLIPDHDDDVTTTPSKLVLEDKLPPLDMSLGPSEIERKAKVILRQYWGHEKFRDNQLDIITHVASGNNALVLMPTGGGKNQNLLSFLHFCKESRFAFSFRPC